VYPNLIFCRLEEAMVLPPSPPPKTPRVDWLATIMWLR